MTAQEARRKNLASGRGRKGRLITNLFAGILTCAYCANPIRFHSNGNAKSLICSTVLAGANGHCDRTERDCFRTKDRKRRRGPDRGQARCPYQARRPETIFRDQVSRRRRVHRVSGRQIGLYLRQRKSPRQFPAEGSLRLSQTTVIRSYAERGS
jgi:hypothetical protein